MTELSLSTLMQGTLTFAVANCAHCERGIHGAHQFDGR